jgi:hypothetical protein
VSARSRSPAKKPASTPHPSSGMPQRRCPFRRLQRPRIRARARVYHLRHVHPGMGRLQAGHRRWRASAARAQAKRRPARAWQGWTRCAPRLAEVNSSGSFQIAAVSGGRLSIRCPARCSSDPHVYSTAWPILVGSRPSNVRILRLLTLRQTDFLWHGRRRALITFCRKCQSEKFPCGHSRDHLT